MKHNYSFTDFTVLHGTSYYRLKQVDFDGEHEYSKLVWVTAGQAKKPTVQAYPNPFDRDLSVRLPATESCRVTLQLVDVKGQVVYSQDAQLERGIQEVTLPLPALSGGVYILRIIGGELNQFLKVIKVQ